MRHWLNARPYYVRFWKSFWTTYIKRFLSTKLHIFFHFRLPKLKVDQLCLNGVLQFVIPKVMDQWPNLSPWNISVNPIFVMKFACQIKEKMANTGKFCQESTILKRLDFPAKTMCIFSSEQKIWQQKDSGLCFGILFSKLFWPSVRKECSCDREKLSKFEVECQEFANFLISL